MTFFFPKRSTAVLVNHITSLRGNRQTVRAVQIARGGGLNVQSVFFHQLQPCLTAGGEENMNQTLHSGLNLD